MKRILIVLMVCVLMFTMIACQDNNNVEVNNNKEVDNTENDEVVENEPEAKEYGDFKGYLWEVKNGDSTVYLFGSIHISDENTYPFQQVVEDAYESADILGVEADVTDTAAVMASASLMTYENGETVYDHLSEEGIIKFEAMVAETAYTTQMLEKFRIWVAGSTIMQLQIMSEGFTSGEGIDIHFLNRAKESGKEVVELEGIIPQIELINGFTDAQQEAMFITGLGTKEESIDEFKTMYEKFMAGDDADLTEYLFSADGDLAADEEVEKAMLETRNIGMANKIDEYLQTDQTYFIVVGVAHYLGDESVIKFLEEKGYTVERK